MIKNTKRIFMSPRSRRFFCTLFSLAAVLAVLAAISSSRATDQTGSAPAPKIAPWVMDHTANGQQAEFIVVLADQADLSAARALRTKAEKGRFVRDTLWNKSQITQGPILQWLRARGIEYRSFYSVNALWVKGDRALAEALAARPDVARVEGNPRIQNFPEGRQAVETSSQPNAAETIEPGVNYVHAPQVWALGHTGEGVVIAGADTGVRWTHNALKPHYRGWDGSVADHDYNWHDSIHDSSGNPCGNNSTQPCDDFFHGSHTIGTAIGDDNGANQIGVAHGAQWIACRNMDEGVGTPARYIECMDFFLAPYPVGGDPSQGDPAKAPDITTNSWGCPSSEGCAVNTLQAAVEGQRAAGIEMVVAAGNSGPGCSTLFDPPSFYDASYTAGALNTGTDTLASFSSRGPVTADGSNRIKPDITAPGTNTRSASNSADNAYTIASGTSMATPHIAGCVALLWSARPDLRTDLDATEAALNNSAVHINTTSCSSSGIPNNLFGWGRVDAAAAVGGGTPTPTPTPTPVPVSVGVSAPQTDVTEGGTASFVVRATTTVTQSVTVNYSMSGTASLGPDYTLNTAGQVTIPAGQSSGKAKLRARTDSLTEGSETAIMTLQPGPGYTIGNKNQATVSIADP
jgi:serine protease AprX